MSTAACMTLLGAAHLQRKLPGAVHAPPVALCQGTPCLRRLTASTAHSKRAPASCTKHSCRASLQTRHQSHSRPRRRSQTDVRVALGEQTARLLAWVSRAAPSLARCLVRCSSSAWPKARASGAMMASAATARSAAAGCGCNHHLSSHP